VRLTTHSHVTDADAIIEAAWSALERGATGLRFDVSAKLSFRNRLVPKISSALEHPDWREAWRREQAYVLAYAEAMGRRAAAFAAEEGRRRLVDRDIEDATTKLRGYIPVAGRWCPL
jgi:hypothetical protein